MKGKQIGYLTVLKKVGMRMSGEKNRSVYLCECACGKKKEIFAQSLRAKPPTKSCGCLQKETTRKLGYKHGQVGTALYRRWRSMRDRCLVKTKREYPRYGGRGIKVCKKWNDFKKFQKDMGGGFRPDLELDRINNDGDYKPSNCRWATRQEQVNNKNNNVNLTHNGKTQTRAQWARELGLTYGTLRGRLRKKSLSDIINDL